MVSPDTSGYLSYSNLIANLSFGLYLSIFGCCDNNPIIDLWGKKRPRFCPKYCVAASTSVHALNLFLPVTK